MEPAPSTRLEDELDGLTKAALIQLCLRLSARYSTAEFNSLLHEQQALKNLKSTPLQDPRKRMKVENTKTLGKAEAAHEGSGSLPLKGKKQKKAAREFCMDRYRQRYIALHLMYLGHNYHGLAAQPHLSETIEHHLFKALKFTKLVVSREQSGYTRCGRTDKGVSAFHQVVTLSVRSIAGADSGLPPPWRELDYCKLLNRSLPSDIRALGWTDVHPKFSARFHCSARTYRYFFVRRMLDIEAMQQGAKFLLGNHDFRNFCKIDIMNVNNFRREILQADIRRVPWDEDQFPSRQVYYLEIKGQAFLWHQVRCMMAVLFLVGRGLEQPRVVQDMLDIKNNPRKPDYSPADELPLILYDCEFPQLAFGRSIEGLETAASKLEEEWEKNTIKAQIIRSTLLDIAEFPVAGEEITDTQASWAAPPPSDYDPTSPEKTYAQDRGESKDEGGMMERDESEDLDEGFNDRRVTLKGPNPAKPFWCKLEALRPWKDVMHTIETGRSGKWNYFANASYPMTGKYTQLMSRQKGPSLEERYESLPEEKKRLRHQLHPEMNEEIGTGAKR